ncbi:MAG: queuosine precursor transporter [Legionellales bacterium]|nr:queuosine precursor transporter [Legionellales bacterium]
MNQASYQKQLTNQPKYLNFLSIIYVAFLLVASLIVHKMVTLGGLTVSASTLIFPFTYFLGDVIAEVYGYKVSRQLIWAAFCAIFIFDMLSALIIKLPSPSSWIQQAAYNTVISPLPRTFWGDFVGLNVGAFVNVYLITKSKIILRGRFFLLRSLLSTAVGEAMFNIIAFSIVFIGVIPINEILGAMFFSYIYKAIFALLAVFPAYLIAKFLKKRENLDVYDYNTNFNPFKLEL